MPAQRNAGQHVSQFSQAETSGAGGLWTRRSLRTEVVESREGNSLPAEPRESKEHPFQLWDINSGAADNRALAALARCLRPRAAGKCEFMLGGMKRVSSSSRKDQPQTAKG